MYNLFHIKNTICIYTVNIFISEKPVKGLQKYFHIYQNKEEAGTDAFQ